MFDFTFWGSESNESKTNFQIMLGREDEGDLI